MQTDLERSLQLRYPAQVVPEATTAGTTVYLASHPDLPGCMAHGDTPEEALENLTEARELYLETLAERELPIPMPQQPVDTIVWRSFGVHEAAPSSDGPYHETLPAPQTPRLVITAGSTRIR